MESREKDNSCWDEAVGGKAGGKGLGSGLYESGCREGEVTRQAVLLLSLGSPLYSRPKYFLDERSALL